MKNNKDLFKVKKQKLRPAKTKLFEFYPIGSEWMYDFELGKGEFRRVKIKSIICKNEIWCFEFENTTGFWPIQYNLIKEMKDYGIGELFINSYYKQSKKRQYENV